MLHALGDDNSVMAILEEQSQQSNHPSEKFVQISKVFVRKNVIIFLSMNFNICFGCSKEPSHWDGSFEYTQYMIGWEIRKSIFNYTLFILVPIIKVILRNMITCINTSRCQGLTVKIPSSKPYPLGCHLCSQVFKRVIRDYLMAFWLSPEVSTRDPIISRRALARGLIMVEGWYWGR